MTQCIDDRPGQGWGTRFSRGLFACWLVLAGGAAVAADPEPVASLLELRQDRVVLQKWDLSCGAAALATLLTYQHDDPIAERDIAKAMISREKYLASPDVVRAQQGFSLLDLKRYVDGRGYRGTGYRDLDVEDLIRLAPILIPIEHHGFNHFVVFRGVYGNRVLLADPAWGNRTMRIDQFEQAWLDHPRLGKVGFVVARQDGTRPPNRLAVAPEDFPSLN